MEVLDGDDVRLTSRGKTAERDIVQVTSLSFLRTLSFLLDVMLAFCFDEAHKYLANNFLLSKIIEKKIG